MRNATIAIVFVWVFVTVGRAGEAPPAQPVDLKKNQLVQKALADQEKAVAAAEEDYAKKLEALNAERQKKLAAARSACVTALRRAEGVAAARNNKEEALTIKALADSIAAEAPAESKPAAPANKLVGKWKTKDGGFVLEADGTCHSTSIQLTGKWLINQKGELELHWPGFLDTFKQLDAGKLKRLDGLEAVRVP